MITVTRPYSGVVIVSTSDMNYVLLEGQENNHDSSFDKFLWNVVDTIAGLQHTITELEQEIENVKEEYEKLDDLTLHFRKQHER